MIVKALKSFDFRNPDGTAVEITKGELVEVTKEMAATYPDTFEAVKHGSNKRKKR